MLRQFMTAMIGWALQPFALITATLDGSDEVWEPFLVEDDRIEWDRFGGRG